MQADNENKKNVKQFLDIPIVKLIPLRKRNISKQAFKRIIASIKLCGLLAPLLVYPENDNFIILDGYQRYLALLELGVEIVPCISWNQKEAFSANRMVNRLSPIQESRMIERALSELDEKTIANAFGLDQIGHRKQKTMIKHLHVDVASALDNGLITKACARELTFVNAERQIEIVNSMKQYNDFGVAFARNMILKTPPKQRTQKKCGKKSPWAHVEQKKDELMSKLQESEQKHNFYSRLYKQYSIDLLKLTIYTRSMITNMRIRDYLQVNHQNIFGHFEKTIASAEG
jgi:hypothetical protein